MAMPMWEDLEVKMDPYEFDVTEVLKRYNLPEWMKIWWSGDLHINPQNVLSLFYMVKDYDLLHLHSPSPIYLQFSGKPFVIHEAGWIRKLVTRNTASEKLGRRAYSRAEFLVMTNPDTYTLLRRLTYKREVFVPFIVDTERYKSIKVKKPEQNVFFHPTRHVWDVKGNNKLICAFKKFIDDGYKAKLRMVDWGWLEDVGKTKELVRNLKLEHYVEWVQPYSKPALIRAYNEADVVFDQFILGSGGTTMFEAMSCEVPVVIYLNRWNKKCFGEMPPIVNVRTVDEIHESMVLLSDRKIRKEIGIKQRKFVLKHNHPDIVAENLVHLYEGLG
jgi:glycosyltransferase involved in cell wall biosynthesis